MYIDCIVLVIYSDWWTTMDTASGVTGTSFIGIPQSIKFKNNHSALVRPCFGLFPFLPTFLSSRFLTTRLLLFLSVSSSCFTLVLMREVSCVGYIPRAWDTSSLQSILDGLLFFETKWLNGRNVAFDRPIRWITEIIIVVSKRFIPTQFQEAFVHNLEFSYCSYIYEFLEQCKIILLDGLLMSIEV